jgi:hypothetical protein
MHDPSIRLSPTHGLNPVIPRCFFCGERKNEVVLPGLLEGDVEAPRDAVWDHTPCDQCQQYMREGIIVISVRDGESGDNPYRTGGWCVLTEAAVRRLIQPASLVDAIVKKRVAFVPDQVWDLLGLPRGVQKGES